MRGARGGRWREGGGGGGRGKQGGGGGGGGVEAGQKTCTGGSRSRKSGSRGRGRCGRWGKYRGAEAMRREVEEEATPLRPLSLPSSLDLMTFFLLVFSAAPYFLSYLASFFLSLPLRPSDGSLASSSSRALLLSRQVVEAFPRFSLRTRVAPGPRLREKPAEISSLGETRSGESIEKSAEGRTLLRSAALLPSIRPEK